MDVQTFVNSLAELAEKSPEARAFILAFLLELIFLVGIVAFFLQRVVNRRRQSEPDEDVSDPTRDLAVAMSKQADALLTIANTLVPMLKVLTDQAQSQEAQIAGVRGEQTALQQAVSTSTTNLLEAQRTMTVALEALITKTAGSETAEKAEASRLQAVVDINAHTDKAVEAMGTKVDGLPDAVVSKSKTELLPLYKGIYDKLAADNERLVAERDEARKQTNAEREMKEQAQASLATLQSQNAKLTADLLARDTTIDALTEQLRAANAALPKVPEPSADRPTGGAA